MISRTLVHVYGPFSIYSFGAMIALGCLITYRLLLVDKKRVQLISVENLLNVFTLSIISGLVGGRLLYAFESNMSWSELPAIHEGGFSVLGALILLVCTVPFYLKKIGTPILPFMDLMALYAPLLQAISRLGCFFAGCCYGKPTDVPWAVMYTTQDTLAPIFCKIHPTQVYTAGGDLLLFLCTYFILRKRLKKPGQLLFSYLALSSLIRFVTDFWRADQTFLSTPFLRIFSLHQWIALVIISISSCLIAATRKDGTV